MNFAGFDLVQTWITEGLLPGAAALVVRRGEIVAERYFGVRQRGTADQPVGSDTIFAVASISKPVTAAALFRLVERGALSVDQPVIDFLPEFDGPGKSAVTVRQLLRHTSGVHHGWAEGFVGRSSAEFTAAAAALPLRDEPDTRVNYSNVGYCLLGAIVERASGADFETTVGREIFAPLGLTDIGFTAPANLWPRIATVEDPRLPTDEVQSNSPFYRAVPRSWGSLMATARQIATIYGALNLARPSALFQPATIQTMTRADTVGLPGGIEGYYPWPRCAWGLGVEVKGDKAPHWSGELASSETFGHLGANGTMVWVDPTRDLLWLLLTNHSLMDGWAIKQARHARFSNTVLTAFG